jgi:hypothetical protein
MCCPSQKKEDWLIVNKNRPAGIVQDGFDVC